MAVEVSQLEVRVAPATLLKSLSASQTLSAFAQTATASPLSTGTTDISYLTLITPGTALSTLNLVGAQAVGAFTQVVSLFDVVGTIDGGGTISDGKPHRSMGGTQSVGTFQQSSAIGAEGTAGPALVQAAQQVASFAQAATAEAARTITITQPIGTFSQSGLVSVIPGLVASQQVDPFNFAAANVTVNVNYRAVQTVGAFTQTARADVPGLGRPLTRRRIIRRIVQQVRRRVG